jgi:5-methylcytosine-specific restriction endonuclease McrA
MTRLYCVYCGRVQHRCGCAATDSDLRQFLARCPADYNPLWMTAPYKRGVPPQIKRRERNAMRRNYTDFYNLLVERHGEQCANCGAATQLVVDHILSIAKGGLSEIENLQLLCSGCNTLKGKLCIDCRSVTYNT